METRSLPRAVLIRYPLNMSRRKQINQTAAAPEIGAVLEELRHAPEGISARDLAELLELNRTEQKVLKELLNRLQGVGLLRRHGQEFRLSESQRAMVGRVRQRR